VEFIHDWTCICTHKLITKVDYPPSGLIDVSEILRYLHGDCYLDKKSAAEYLSWSVRKLEQYLPEIPHFKHNGKVYFRRSQLDEYMSRFEVPCEHEGLRLMTEEAMSKLHEQEDQ